MCCNTILKCIIALDKTLTLYVELLAHDFIWTLNRWYFWAKYGTLDTAV